MIAFFKRTVFFFRLPFFFIGGGIEFVQNYHLITIALLSMIRLILLDAVERGQKLGIKDDYLAEVLTKLQNCQKNPIETADLLVKMFDAKLAQRGDFNEFYGSAKDLTNT